MGFPFFATDVRHVPGWLRILRIGPDVVTIFSMAFLHRVLLLDNFDSFTHNIHQGLVQAGAEVTVLRSDKGGLQDIEAAKPDLLILGPGPGRPEKARLCLEALQSFAGQMPIFGICLGHQCLAHFFGGSVGRSPQPVHGKVSPVFHDGKGLFQGLPQPFPAGRYHSLSVVDLPEALLQTAWTAEGLNMGLRHKELPIFGVQFHPDSFLCPLGVEIFRNALRQ